MPTSIALTTQPTRHLPRRTSDNSASTPTTHCRLGTTLSLRICELILSSALMTQVLTELAKNLSLHRPPDFAQLRSCNCAKSGDHKGKKCPTWLVPACPAYEQKCLND